MPSPSSHAATAAAATAASGYQRRGERRGRSATQAGSRNLMTRSMDDGMASSSPSSLGSDAGAAASGCSARASPASHVAGRDSDSDRTDSDDGAPLPSAAASRRRGASSGAVTGEPVERKFSVFSSSRLLVEERERRTSLLGEHALGKPGSSLSLTLGKEHEEQPESPAAASSDQYVISPGSKARQHTSGLQSLSVSVRERWQHTVPVHACTMNVARVSDQYWRSRHFCARRLHRVCAMAAPAILCCPSKRSATLCAESKRSSCVAGLLEPDPPLKAPRKVLGPWQPLRGQDGGLVAMARPALLRSWVVFKLPPRLESYILHVKPSARTHTAAPHCDSHCQQLRVVLTLQFLQWARSSARTKRSVANWTTRAMSYRRPRRCSRLKMRRRPAHSGAWRSWLDGRPRSRRASWCVS